MNGLNDLSTKLDDSRLTHGQIIAQSKKSRPARWLLALYRIADVVNDKRSEVRNGSFQTLLRIFKNHADDLSTPGWQLCFETLLLKILREDVIRQKGSKGESQSIEAVIASDTTSKTLLEEIATLVSENLGTISSSKSFDRLWSELLNVFQEYLSCSSAVVVAALFTAVTTPLRAINTADQQWKPAVKEVALLWSSGIPAVKGQDAEQQAYLAYADCATELYRLTGHSITADELKTMALDLFECICASNGGVDISNMTPLQNKVLECLKMLRTDIDSVASTLIKIASTFVRLPFDDPSHPKPRTDLTFVALSKASMEWLVQLVTSHLRYEDVFTSNSVARSLESLVIPIKRKYTWKQNGKGPAPWQKAIPSSLSIIEPALIRMQTLSTSQETKSRVWRAIVKIAHEIMHADLTAVIPRPSLDVLEKDEISDCESLKRLRSMIIPSLGSSSLHDNQRTTYVSSLFHASIIHEPEHGDVPSSELSPLTDLSSVRLGRVRDPPPTPRENMAYLCLNELIALTSKSTASRNDDNMVRLAQAAAPWLLLRLAIPLKAYIADQPLRGTMPMPLSQVEELLYCLQSMRELLCEPKALIDDKEARRQHEGKGEKMHLKWLFPLVVRAVTVAGEERHGNAKVLDALREVLDVAGDGL